MVSARWLAYDDDQTYVHEAAEVVADALYDPVLGACEPAVAGLRVLRDPTREVLEERIREAFAAASRAGATLVLYLIGHGSSDFDDDLYHFIPADHPLSLLELPDRGYPLGARLRALHGEFPGSDGVILVIDTCESGRLADERTWSMPMKHVRLHRRREHGRAARGSRNPSLPRHARASRPAGRRGPAGRGQLPRRTPGDTVNRATAQKNPSVIRARTATRVAPPTTFS